MGRRAHAARRWRVAHALLPLAVPTNHPLQAATGSSYNPDANWPHPHARELATTVKVDAGGRLLPVATVNIFGLTRPVSVAWHVAGARTTVLVAEKSGVVKYMDSWVGQPTNTLLDISAQVDSHGDHGLTGITVVGDYLYATYMVAQAPWGSTGCTDSGFPQGRDNNQITGCPISGRLSRWPLVGGRLTGPEQVLVEGREHGYCCQFSTHSMSSPILHDDGRIYWENGDGAAFAMIDAGDLGNNPCNDTFPYVGAFRSQDPTRLNGKVASIDPVTLEWHIVSTGHRNGFRLTSHRGHVYATDTGWYTVEEVNQVGQGLNFGWPCMEGPERTNEYGDSRLWALVCEGKNFTPPTIYYRHPVPPPPGNVMSISAVGGNPITNRLYYGDFTQGWIRSVNDVTFQDERLEATDAYPVELKMTPQGFVYVDHTHGMVRSLANAGGLPATPSSSPAPPMAVVHPPPAPVPWTPSSRVNITFTNDNNVEGREGTIYSWKASLLYNCNHNVSSCMALPLANVTFGDRSWTIATPPYAGTIEAVLSVSSYGGIAAASAPVYLAASGVEPCLCTGPRIVTAQFAGSASPTPSASRGARAGPKSRGSGGVDTRSPLFVGLVSAFSALAAVGVVVAAMYFTGGLAALRGSGSRVGDAAGLARPLRRPTTQTASGEPAGGEPRRIVAAAASTPTSAPGVTAAAGAGGTSTSVASRRAAVIPPLDDSAAAGGGSAPARPSPVDGNGVRQRTPNKTPSGGRV